MATLIEELTPQIVAAVESAKEDLIARVPTLFERMIARAAWPILIGWLPGILSASYASLMDRFGKMTLDEIIDRINTDTRTVYHTIDQNRKKEG